MHNEKQRERPQKTLASGLDLHHIRQCILHNIAVATEASITPGDNGTVAANGSKCLERGVDLSHIPEPLLCIASVATMSWPTPALDRSIAQNGGESRDSGLNLNRR